jgi:uncharacterized RDD family membrane protein YckC
VTVPERASGATPAAGRDSPATPGFVVRLLALTYEALLLVAVVFAATLLFLGAAHVTGAAFPRWLLQTYLPVVGACYFVPQWRAGQTLPMKTWRIRLTTARGERLSLRTAVLRYVLALAGWVPLGAGYLWALLDRDGQFLHDRLAGTRLTVMPLRS